jgi:hypothetical protein
MPEKLTRAEAARRNGARSKGPTTPQGKSRSSQNAITHGLTACSFLFTPSEEELFQQHLAAVRGHWNPQSAYELYLVGKLARAEYLHDRAEAIQVSLLDLELDTNAAKIIDAFDSIDPAGLLAIGYKSLDDHSPAYRNMDRHLVRLSRERVRLTDLLRSVIAVRLPSGAEGDPEAPSQQIIFPHEPNNPLPEVPPCPAA